MTDIDSDILTDGYGHTTRRSSVRPRVLREHGLVAGLIAEADELQALLSLFKAKCFDEIAAFREELARQYGANVGGTRGGLTVSNYGDTLRITVSEADSMTFGAELESAKALIDECLNDWTQGGNENLRTVVNDAFHVGEGKKVRMDRVLGLRRLNITNDDRWLRAMTAISDAVQTERSKLYIRLYRRRKPEDKFELIVLDMARVK